MRRFLLLLPLVALLGLSVLFFKGLSHDDSVPSALLSRPFPAFSLPDLRQPEKVLTEDMLKGQVSLVNVWATWCHTCYVEFPFLMKLHNKGIVIYGFDYKDDSTKAKRWLENLGNPYKTNVVDKDGRFAIDLGVRGAPETFLVDSNGVIRYKYEGALSPEVWKHDFEPLLAQLHKESKEGHL